MMLMQLADPQPPGPAPTGQGPFHDAEEKATVVEEVNNVFTAMLPWGIALLFHAGLILIAAFVAWSTIVTPDENEIIIPVMNFSEHVTEPLEVEAEDRIEESRTERQVTRPDRPQEAQPSDFEARIDTPTTLVGLEGASDASPFATTATSAGQFQAEMFGIVGNARRLVFCIDTSGSLLDTFPYIIHELVHSIRRLSEQQQFAVVFFRGDDVIEVPPPGMQQATSQNKERAIAWINPDTGYNVIPGGRSNPSNAIRHAMRYRPDLIYLLSDNITGSGRYESSQAAVLGEIQRANVANTKINTIQFIYPDPLVRHGFTGTMELIAKRTGGIYRFVSAEELNLR